MDINLAFQNADVLRAIITHGALTAPAELARITGRDKSNLAKTLGRLVEGGVITRETGSLVICDAAHQVVAAADIAEGKVAAPPAGFSALFHAQIQPDSLNPRRDFESIDFKDELDELRQDILQNGLLQNLVVRLAEPCKYIKLTDDAGHDLPLYRLVSGERRWRAIRAAIQDGDWPENRPVPVQIIETDDLGHRLKAFAENKQRRDLSVIEEALFYKGLATRDGWSTDQIADEAKVSRRQVQLRLQLLELSPRDQERMELPKEDPDHLTVRDAKKKLQQPKIAPPTAEDLSLVERMILAELLVACANANNQSSYYSTEIGPDHSEGPFGEGLAALVKRGWVYVSGPGYQDGRWKAQTYYSGRDWLDKVYSDFAPPAVGTAGHLRVVARAIRAELHDAITAAASYGDDGGSYAAPWLNGPFELSPEGQAIVNLRAQEKADQAAKAETEAAEKAKGLRNGRLAFDIARELEADMAKRTGFAVTDRRINQVLEVANAPLPWRILTNATVVDANGKDVIIGRPGNGESNARMLAMVLAVNAAAGFNTPPEEPTENVMRRADFEKAMADYIALGFDDMEADTALGHARDALEAYLDRHAINYAAPNHSWTEAGAKGVVDDTPDEDPLNGGDEDEEG